MNGAALESYTRQELLVLARQARVRGRHRMSKDQLIATIRSVAATPGRRRRSATSTGRETRTPGNGASVDAAAVASSAGRAPQAARRTAASGGGREPELRELTELPTSYGRTRLTLMMIDPYRIHAYWELTPQDHEATLARLGPERVAARWVLRFYDVTRMDFDGTNAHSHFDQPIELGAGNWYVHLWSSEKSYCADIGALAPSGRFAFACRSNLVDTPRTEPAPHYGPEWLHVEAIETPNAPLTITATVAQPWPPDAAQPVTEADVRDYYDELLVSPEQSEPEPTPPAAAPAPRIEAPTADDRTQALAPPIARRMNPTPPAQEDAVEEVRLDRPADQPRREDVRRVAPPLPTHVEEAWPAAQRERRLPETVSSFGSGGWAPNGRAAAVDLQLNAELVISGRTQPGQAVQVNGQWTKANADGTFSLRLALPIRQ